MPSPPGRCASARARCHARARVAAREHERREGRAPSCAAGEPGEEREIWAERADVPEDVAVLPGAPPWTGSVLSALPGSSTVLRPERDPAGEVSDFTVVAANDRELSGGLRTPARLIGRPISEVRPGVHASGMFALYCEALRDGRPVASDAFDYVDVVEGAVHRARLSGVVSPLAGEDGLLLTHWQPVGEAAIGQRVQRTGRMGWAEWDLVSGRVQWSVGMRRLLGLEEAPAEDDVPDGTGAAETADTAGTAGAPGGERAGWETGVRRGRAGGRGGGTAPLVAQARDPAADILSVGRLVERSDVPGFVQDVRELLTGGEIADRELTLHTPAGTRRVRWLGQAQPAGSDPPTTVLFAARDITEQEERLRSALSTAERLRQEAAAERRVSETLRGALTPPLPVVGAEGISVGAAFVPSDHRIGGDWYKCRELLDGRVLLAVGDASGHGVDAASRAVQQRSALAGLAYTDGDPGELATALGEVVYYSGVDSTATAVIGHLDPASRRFRWASAGHPTPLLVRDGEPRVPDAEHGLMFGVAPEPSYPVNCTLLRPGDLLVFYTDGVIESRGQDLDAGTRALIDAVRECAAGGDGGARAVADRVMGEILGPEAEDDATVFVLRVA